MTNSLRAILFVLALFLSCTEAVEAQTDYRQRQLTMDDGLPSNSVRAVLQDGRGFLWIGTDKGLCRYDGVVLQDYPVKENAASQNVAALQGDGTRGLFVGIGHSVLYLDFVTEKFETLPMEIARPVTSLAADRDSNLWVGTQGQGVLRYNLADRQAKVYTMGDSAATVSMVYADADNQVWALSAPEESKVWRLNKSKDVFQPVALKSDQPYGAVTMLQTANGQRWLGTWEHGLMRMADDGTLEPMPAPQSGNCLHIHTLSRYDDQQLLVGCDDGLWLFNMANRTFQLYQPQHFIYAATLDREGGLWLGTKYGGITYVSPIVHRFDATPGGIATRFCEDRHGRIWVASDDMGVMCFQRGKRLAAYPGQQQLQQISAHALCMDGDELWIGTFTDGVYVLNTNTGSLRHYAPSATPFSLPEAHASALLRDSRGRMYVATPGALCRYDRQNDRFERIMQIGALPVDMDEGADGSLWIATQGEGLYRYGANGASKHYRHSPVDDATLTDDLVNCALFDEAGTLWVATQGGLCRYDAKADNFRRIKLDVPKQAVASIVEDQGVLWLAGDCGVLKYSPGKDLQRFTRHDGLVSEQFQPSSCLKASDGCIYFGTIRGFNSFYPYQIRVNQQQPPVFITRLDVYNFPVEVGSWRLPVALPSVDKVDLWYNDRVVSLAFASLSFCSPEKNIYAYILEGFDKEWQYVGHNHKATYTNLPVGTYTFRVRATNNDGLWGQNEARLTIVVHPPFWWSLPAKVFYVVLAIVMLWLLMRWRLLLAGRKHRKEMALLSEAKEEEVRNARMEFFTMIAHEIRTPVSLIIGPVEQLKGSLSDAQRSTLLETIDRNAHRLLELVNQLLDFRKVEHGGMDGHFALHDIPELMASVAKNFRPVTEQKGHQLHVACEPASFKAVADREAIVKLTSNLLSNADKYTTSRIELRCQLQPDGKHWLIEVEDDGRGISASDQRHIFDPFFQSKGSKPGTGIGLSIVKRIAQLHHGQVSISSEVGKGTIFRVEMPIAQPAFAANVADGPDTKAKAKETLPGKEPKGGVTGTGAGTAKPQGAVAEAQQTAPAVVSRPTLLIVDDNEEMLTFLVTTFMDHYEVLSASDGAEALKLLEESLVVREQGVPTSTIDLIISDWMMTTMDGPELCSRLRQNAATEHIPFVLLTAKTDSQSKVLAMQAGVDAYIEKPFPVKYLEACLQNLLRRRAKN